MQYCWMKHKKWQPMRYSVRHRVTRISDILLSQTNCMSSAWLQVMYSETQIQFCICTIALSEQISYLYIKPWLTLQCPSTRSKFLHSTIQRLLKGSVHISLYNSVLFWPKLNVFQKIWNYHQGGEKGCRTWIWGQKLHNYARCRVIAPSAAYHKICFWRMIWLFLF